MLTVLPTHFKLVPLCRTSESYFILIWDTVSKVAVNIYKHLYQPSSSSEYAEDQRNIMTFLRYLNFSAVLSFISRKNTNWSEEGNWLQETSNDLSTSTRLSSDGTDKMMSDQMMITIREKSLSIKFLGAVADFHVPKVRAKYFEPLFLKN